LYIDRKKLRMTREEQDEFLAGSAFGRLATADREGNPHVAPIAYVYLHGAVYFLSLVRSRRTRDLSVNSSVSLCVDDGAGVDTPYTERRGVIVYGQCVPAADDPVIVDEAPTALMNKFGYENRAQVERITHEWYRIDVTRTASWNFRKIPAGQDRAADRVRQAGSALPGLSTSREE
jgi:nitroimidazol reductase NimA-like FMN-containing flavoprotein (pyridoxamine 5'-phosphate oxidase superfamily)